MELYSWLHKGEVPRVWGSCLEERCISNLLLCNKLLQNSVAYYSTHMLSHHFSRSGIWDDLPGSSVSWFPAIVQSKYQPRYVVSSESSAEGKIYFQASWYWQNLFLCVLLDWRQHFSPPTGWRLLWVPFPVDFSNMAGCFVKTCKPKRWKREPAYKMGIVVVCNLTVEVAPYLFFILIITFASAWQITRFSPHSKKRNYTCAWILRGRSPGCCPDKSAYLERTHDSRSIRRWYQCT